MNKEDIEQIKNKLRKEYYENCSRIKKLNQKIKIVSRNNFNTKIKISLALSVIPWLLNMAFSATIIKNKIIPFNIYQKIFIISPLFIGITGNIILNIKQKIKPKLRNFSNSKRQKDKMVEETRYKIEREKLLTENMIIKKACKSLDLDKKNIQNLNDKSSKMDEEEMISYIEDLENNYDKSKEKLERIATKYVIIDSLLNVRDGFEKFYQIILYGGIGVMLSMFYYILPIVITNKIANFKINLDITETLLPIIMSGIISIGYGMKNQLDENRTIKIVNKYKNNKLNDDVEEIEYEKQQQKIIKEAHITRIKLETKKQELEKIKNTKVNNNKLEFNYTKENNYPNYSNNYEEYENNLYQTPRKR